MQQLSLTSPLSLYSIPALWLLAYYPLALKSYTIIRSIGYDNVNPRTNVARMREDKRVKPDVAAHVARMEGAHFNGLESFTLWSVAIILGNYAGMDDRTLNVLSGFYLFSRVLYTYLYITQKAPPRSYMRSAVWSVGLYFPFRLMLESLKILSQRGNK